MSSAVRNIAYGLVIDSSLPLPELATTEPALAADLTIGLLPGELAHSSATRLDIRPDHACLAWPGVGIFTLRGGSEIGVAPAPGAEARLLRTFLLGPVLSVALHQRGGLVLHASAVGMDGAIAFLGEQHSGKSTMAGALHARGHPLVADDVLAVEDSVHGPVVHPGFPMLKLWPDSGHALGLPDALPRLHSGVAKRVAPAHCGFTTAPLPLRRVYVLSRGRDTRIEGLSATAAVLALVRHSYGARVLHAADPGLHLRRCASLARRVRVRRLTVGDSLDRLAETARLVEDDVVSASA